MGDEIDAVDQYGNKYKACRVGSGGDGCFTGLIFIIGLVIVLIVGGVYGIWWGWSSAQNYFTYHLWDANRSQAATDAVQNVVGKDKFVGIAEFQGNGLSGSYAFSDGHLDSALGGFPIRVVTLYAGAAASFMVNGYDTISTECKTSGCVLTVYIQKGSLAHTMNINIDSFGFSHYTRDYSLSIPAGSISGTLNIKGCGTDCGANVEYSIGISGSSEGIPLEAIVVGQTGQQPVSASTQSTPQPTPKPKVRVNVSSHFAGTIYQDQDGASYDVRLEITKQNDDGTFSGKWYSTINGSEEDLNVTGVIAPYSKRYQFSQIDQTKLNGNYPDNNFIWFKSTSRDVGQDIWLGCEYYGRMMENLSNGDQNGTMHGEWYPPGSSERGGTFSLDS